MSSESQKVEEKPIVTSVAKKVKKKKVVRPKTGYNLFVADKIKEIKDVDQKEKMKHVGDLWKKASDKEKSKYTKMASQLKKEFEEANPVEKKKPKRGMSGYNVYMKEKIKDVKGANQKEKLLAVSESWKKLSEKDKQKYKDKAKTINEK
tara:strand:+ start:1841 stop:2287 length:447 start_codon:yes stop_codon:yes gene_type:complete